MVRQNQELDKETSPMQSLFERLTALTVDDIHSHHTLSIAATEYALEADDPDIGSNRLQVAHQLRSMEDAHHHDGVPTHALDALRHAVDVQDDEEGEMKALYIFRAEIDRMVVAINL
jgi:hypothetical protein